MICYKFVLMFHPKKIIYLAFKRESLAPGAGGNRAVHPRPLQLRGVGEAAAAQTDRQQLRARGEAEGQHPRPQHRHQHPLPGQPRHRAGGPVGQVSPLQTY